MTWNRKEYMGKYMKEYRKNHKENLDVRATKWREDNPEMSKEHRRKYGQSPKGKAQKKRYNGSHREEQKVSHRKHYKEHKEKIREHNQIPEVKQRRKAYMKTYNKKYYEKNEDVLKIYEKEYKQRSDVKARDKVGMWQNNLKIKYGLTMEDYNKMLKKQGGTCVICRNGNNRRKLCVDHNHKTGKVRGLLCDSCNFTIGHSKEDINLLKKAIKYLEEGTK